MELKSRDARLGSYGGEFYTWKFPGAPVRIRISLDCVEKLRGQVVAAAQPQDGARAEVGGLLLGTSGSQRGDVEVSDFQPLLCDDSPEGRFAISTPAHVEALEQAISAGRNGLAVVGFYRSHLRDGLCLEERDLTIGRIWFSGPSNVFLVIKPTASGSCDAGFFFWDGDQIQSGFSFMEFPFEASLLRRITALEVTSGGAAVPLPPAPIEAPAPAAAAHAPVPKQKSNVLFWLLIAMLLVLSVAIGAGYLLYRNGAIGRTTDTASEQDASLGLRAENRGGDLAITWDRNSPYIRSGRAGKLIIWDGDQPKQEIPLDLAQLRSASVLYAPQTDRIQFRLEVEGERNAFESVLAILRGRARPAVDSRNAPAAPAQTFPAREIKPQTQADAPGVTPQRPVSPPVGEPAAQPAARQVRTFVPPSGSTQPAAPIRTLYLDPPFVSSSPSVAGASQLAAISQTRLPDPPAPAPPPPPEAKPKPVVSPPLNQPAPVAAAAPARAPETKRVDVTYVPPRPVRQVAPSVPNQLLRALINGDTRVEVSAQVDASGRVTGAQVVSGSAHRLLINAITEAAKKWNFEPARLDGKPVSGEARIVFLLRDPRGTVAK